MTKLPKNCHTHNIRAIAHHTGLNDTPFADFDLHDVVALTGWTAKVIARNSDGKPAKFSLTEIQLGYNEAVYSAIRAELSEDTEEEFMNQVQDNLVAANRVMASLKVKKPAVNTVEFELPWN